jgi:predicted nucleic acid-binding protein
MAAIDGLIAVTGLVHNATVVTRNIDDMIQSGVTLFNPWD